MWRWLIERQLFLAGGAALLTAGSLLRLGGSGWDVSVVWVGLATLGFYHLARTDGAAWRSGWSVWLWVGLPSLATIGLAVGFDVAELGLLGVGAGLALLYVLPYQWPVGDAGVRVRPGGLRRVGLLKVGVVAGVWALVSAGWPGLRMHAEIGQVVWLVMERFLFVAGITLPFELRDRLVDRRAGLVTWAHVLGTRRIRWASWGVLVISLVVGLVSPVHRDLLGWVGLLGAHGLAGWLVWRAHTRRRWLYDLGLDGTLWVLAGGEVLWALLGF
ncbi:hypothetical protein [Mucisphaera sp.]|uniref:hypothetical protein n=1 Tax=Mucisphaera sp. TaxID=2913024 RepID=UPI003D1032B3